MSDSETNPYIASLDRYTYAAYIAQAILQVSYAVLFGYTMTRWKILRRAPFILVSTVTLYVACFINFWAFTAQIIQQNIPSNGITDIVYNYNLAETATINATYVLVTLVSQTALVYRLWRLVDRSLSNVWVWIGVFLTFASFVLNLMVIIIIFVNQWKVAYDVFIYVNGSSGICNAFTNGIVTFAIIYHIWTETQNRQARKYAPMLKTPLRRAASAFIESAFAFFVFQLTFCIAAIQAMVLLNRSNITVDGAETFMFYTITPVAGITLTLLVSRVKQSAISAEGQDFINHIYAPWRVVDSEDGIGLRDSAASEPQSHA